MSRLADETLLKRAQHAGRNLICLGTLASFGTVGMLVMAFMGKGALIMLPMAAVIALIAAGYWVLAGAARRGNPMSVGIVIVVLGLQMAVTLITASIASVRTGAEFQPNAAGLIIPLLILIALGSSRKVLVELRERGLWEQAFASSKPSSNLCMIGGTLLVFGFVGLNTTHGLAGWKVGQARTAEVRQVEKFADMLKTEEQAFVASIRSAAGVKGTAAIESAWNKLVALEGKTQSIRKEASDNCALGRILDNYANAVRQWKNGLVILKEPSPDLERAEQMLKLGDKLRAEACGELQRRYAPKRTESTML